MYDMNILPLTIDYSIPASELIASARFDYVSDDAFERLLPRETRTVTVDAALVQPVPKKHYSSIVDMPEGWEAADLRSMIAFAAKYRTEIGDNESIAVRHLMIANKERWWQNMNPVIMTIDGAIGLMAVPIKYVGMGNKIVLVRNRDAR